MIILMRIDKKNGGCIRISYSNHISDKGEHSAHIDAIKVSFPTFFVSVIFGFARDESTIAGVANLRTLMWWGAHMRNS